MINTQVFDTVIAFDYSRGRNVSVTERPRPGFQPIGVPLNGFTAFPSFTVSSGYDNNVYQSSDQKTGDGFVTVAPALRVESNWSANSLVVDGSGTLQRYFNQTPRKENAWTTGIQGRLDFVGNGTLTAGARTSQVYESQFSGAALQNVRSSVPVQVSLVRGVADFHFTRVRGVLAADYSDFNYKSVIATDGTVLNQDSRDRSVARVIGHAEYGLTPDAGLFVELGYTRTGYRTLLTPDIPNRSSDQVQVLAGISVDFTALIRGSLSVGYIDRRYNAPIFNDLKGFSFNAKVEYFPTELTTVTITARREIEDATFIGSSGFFDTGVAVRVDHELLRNLILNGGVDYERDDYRGIATSANVLRASGGAQYLISQRLSLTGTVFYGRRDSDSFLSGPRLSEFRGLAGISFHP